MDLYSFSKKTILSILKVKLIFVTIIFDNEEIKRHNNVCEESC